MLYPDLDEISIFYPSLDEVRKLAEDYNLIPVSIEVHADMETPISLLKRFKENEFCFLLESVEGGEKWARYSFIGKNPFLVVKSNGRSITLEDRHGRISEKNGNPFSFLDKLTASYKAPTLAGLPRFNGGAVGFFGYDMVRQYERLPNVNKDDIGLPECHFMLTDEVLAFDHLKQKIHIIVNMHVDGNVERSYNSTIDRIKEIYREIHLNRWKVEDNTVIPTYQQDVEPGAASSITMEEYCDNVLKAKEYIRNGDIFQVVLSQRFTVSQAADPFNAYRALRVINPSPYMYYLKFRDYCVVGSSPEMLVRVEDGVVETCPIAGTRKRGATKEEDAVLAKELIEDEKERAEHIMLVDLGRNDIGKVSRYGTVFVKDLMHIEKYSHVMHIVTNVQGYMREDKTPFDALMAVFPAGTLTGAPKVRAMEIIDELETVKRGVYGGATGYIGFNGNLDSCITIRTIVFKDSMAYIQAGAGIVADSVPEAEYLECRNKAMALIGALKKARDIK